MAEKEIFNEKTRKAGSITILVAVGGSLFAMAIGWIFMAVIENKIDIRPLSISLDRLSESIIRSDKRNLDRDQALMNTIGSLNARINGNEVRLFRVIKDCGENNIDIKECKETKK